LKALNSSSPAVRRRRRKKSERRSLSPVEYVCSQITNTKSKGKKKKKESLVYVYNKMDRLPQGRQQQSQIYLYTQNEEEINWSLSTGARGSPIVQQ
jgi:hypothetical protein